MKKIIYIATLFLAVGITSCAKEEIVPVSNETNQAPSWSEPTPKSITTSEGENSNTSAAGSTSTGDNDFGKDITDPNNDEELKKKKP